jgi:hypothetical protein
MLMPQAKSTLKLISNIQGYYLKLVSYSRRFKIQIVLTFLDVQFLLCV